MNHGKLKKVAKALQETIGELSAYPLFKLGKNAVYTVQEIVKTTFEAAVNATSIEQIAENREGGPDADTVRYHLNEKLSCDAVEGMLKTKVKWLATSIKRKFGTAMFEVEVKIAEDWTDEMYYGAKGTKSVVGTKPRAGTYWAFEYFTVSLVVAGCRLLLFAYPMDSRENLIFYVNRVLLFLRELGVRISLLLLDRGFRSTDMFAFLKDEKIPVIMPAVQDGKFERWVATQEKFPVRFNGWQMQNKEGESVEVDLAVLEEFFVSYDDKVERRLCGFFTNLPKSAYNGDPEVLARMYRERWGIETAHRCEDEFRIKSTSARGVVRYLYFAVSVLVYDTWVYLNLLFCGDIKDFAISVKKDTMRLVSCWAFLSAWLSCMEHGR